MGYSTVNTSGFFSHFKYSIWRRRAYALWFCEAVASYYYNYALKHSSKIKAFDLTDSFIFTGLHLISLHRSSTFALKSVFSIAKLLHRPIVLSNAAPRCTSMNSVNDAHRLWKLGAPCVNSIQLRSLQCNVILKSDFVWHRRSLTCRRIVPMGGVALCYKTTVNPNVNKKHF